MDSEMQLYVPARTRRRNSACNSRQLCHRWVDDHSIFFFSSRRRHTRFDCDWSSDVCSSDLKRAFRFVRGPVFANIVLADEVNRTPPKTQAALLQAMREHQVTAAGQTHQLPSPDRKSVV